MMWVECEDGSLCNLAVTEALVIGKHNGVVGGHAVVAVGPAGKTIVGTGTEQRCHEILSRLREHVGSRGWPHGKPSGLSVASHLPFDRDGRRET
jgi:hypothetical protein